MTDGSKLQSSDTESLSYFYRYGTSRALYRWLQFRLYLNDPNWQSNLPDSCKEPSLTTAAYLQNWSDHVSPPQVHPVAWLGLNLLAMLAGSSAMIAALSYAGSAPVNLWLVLGLFAGLPLILTVFSAAGVLFGANKSLDASPLTRLVAKSMRLPFHWLQYRQLVVSWSLWQVQSLALLFNVGAVAGFFVVALFKDLSFGWSSTLIDQTSTMVGLLKGFTAPWSILVSLPSDETIAATRFFHNQPLTDPTVGRQWWSTVVMAVLIYGVLPRLLLQQWLQLRFRRALKADITQSGEVERFISGCRRVTTQAAATLVNGDSKTVSEDSVNITSHAYQFVGWQNTSFQGRVVYQLGINRWQQDVEWIQSQLPEIVGPIVVVVDEVKTPTGELADCVELLQKANKQVSIGVVRINEQEGSGAYRSWQLFAKQQGLPLVQVKEGEDA